MRPIWVGKARPECVALEQGCRAFGLIKDEE